MVVAIDVLDSVIEEAWRTISDFYDVTAPLPDTSDLFEGANLLDPIEASERVILNMLVEAIEAIGRFSPWYKLPARAFGIMRICDRTTGYSRWILAPDAQQRWQDLLDPLSHAIRSNTAVLEADRLIGDLLEKTPAGDPCVTVTCSCVPSHNILIPKSILDQAQILCNNCHEPFSQVA
jgi:hypothetical protein